ncbi:MAG TPA: hypothetical protein VII62_00800 [Vicinamibacteria bacterium]|jgi:hypothetical protein
MRLLHAATLTGAVLLLASVASSQGIGDAAAKEKQKRKASPKTAKVYTDDSIGRSLAPVSSNDQPAAPAGAAATPAAGDKPAGAEGAAAAEKPVEDPRVKAEADWRQKLEQARKEEAGYQEMVTKLQLALNDTGGLYSSGRASNVQMLEDNQKKLADVKARIATLEEEGRRNSYR